MSMRKYFLVLVAMVAFVLLLAGCAGTTPTGPLGTPVDLRPLLPADVRARAPADGDYGKYQSAQTKVKVGDPPATVNITWRYFKDGQRAYLLTVSFQVTESSEGLGLSAFTENIPIYVGPSDRAIESLRVSITGNRPSVLGTQSATVSGLILADGRWESQ